MSGWPGATEDEGVVMVVAGAADTVAGEEGEVAAGMADGRIEV